ncbi:hypothetical protein SteCoe_5585 [Stentor coeruleus]|uniref:Uncharacterized protein n=1 Tax=Stentor coeruleus TaxID=5963 RepID=A0A1R2CS19_9CILI|nr:hypothetical protein SteCoe_5585 [Stentor coeruleus]
MLEHNYLITRQYNKVDLLEDSRNKSESNSNLRHSLDMTRSRSSFKKPLKTASNESSKELLNRTSVLPFFRPRSPLSRLPRSLHISRLSILKSNLSKDQSNKKIDNRAATAYFGPNNPLFEAPSPQNPLKGTFLIIKKSDICGLKKKPVIPIKKSSKKLEITSLANAKKGQKLEKLSIKDIKDRLWLSKKRGVIIRDFYAILAKSNGMKIQHNPDFVQSFKYYIGKGNNSKLIKQLMSRRMGWSRVKLGEIHTANFVWTEWIEDSILQSLYLSENLEYTLDILPKPNTYHYRPNNSRRFIVDISPLGFNKIISSSSFKQIQPYIFQPSTLKVYNKISGNHNLSNKKELFINLNTYCRTRNKQVFDYVPITFHITSLKDPKYHEFEKYFHSKANKPNSIWILKPGENTNRGSGIVICTALDQIKQEIAGMWHTVIIQKYIENPFLVYKRKFDIRCYALITCYNGIIQGYYYNEGYIRTSSKSFNLQNIDNLYIHLTNDAVQKHCDDYGKYESGNKMSYGELQKYLDIYYNSRPVNFIEEVGTKIKKIVKDTIKCAVPGIKKKMFSHTFEIFGYDFLLDEEFKPWLLEVNTNPCLELSSSHLARIIPSMLDNAFQLVIDSLFQNNFSLKNDMPAITENKFELVYHSLEGYVPNIN